MIEYDEGQWHLLFLFRLKGSVAHKVTLRFALPSAVLAGVLAWSGYADAAHESGIWDLTESQVWAAVTAITIVLLAFRTKQALGRFWEGTGLLHQMRGEWFDAVSCLMAFSRQAKTKPEEVAEFRGTLVRLTSLMHGCALHEIKAEAKECFEVIDVNGLDSATLNHLRFCKKKGFNLVEVLLHMIQVLVTENHEQSIVKIPPPICSRVYQELSRGMVNLHNAKKITDTQFPFPYAQLIMILLLSHALLTPIVVSSFISQPWWAALITFVPVFGMFSINEVANELEMPFGEDDNDLNLHKFQEEMNGSLLMLIHHNADILPHTTTDAIRDWSLLKHGTKPYDLNQIITYELREGIGRLEQSTWEDAIEKAGVEAVAFSIPGI
jgi:predicted membrane chloride channel (bestrophin family)